MMGAGTAHRIAVEIAAVDMASGVLKGIIGNIGKLAIAAGAVAGVAFIGKKAIDAAIDFESAMAGVYKTVNATQPEIKALGERFRELSKEIPVSAGELAGIAEIAGQLGVPIGEIENFTVTIAKISETTNLTAEQAAMDFARFANIMQMPLSNIGALASSVVDLGNNTATTESEIVNMAMRIAGAGKTVGLTADEIMGMAAALSSVGVNAEMGGTAISRVMSDIASYVSEGGQKLDLLARVSGMTSQKFANNWKNNAAMALNAFIGGLGDLQSTGQDVFGTLDELGFGAVRVRDALLRTAGAGDILTQSLGISKDAMAENSALNIEAGKRFETTESKMKTLSNTLNDLAIAFGEMLLPVVQGVSEVLKPLIGFLKDNKEVVMALTLAVGALSAAYIAFKAALAISSLIHGVSAAITAMTAIMGGATAAQTLLNVAMWACPILAIIGLIALLITNWETVVGVFEGVADALGGVWDFLVDIFGGFVEAIVNGIMSIVQWFVDLPQNILNAIVGIGEWLLQAGADLIEGLKDGIINALVGFGSWLYDNTVGAFLNLLGIHSPSRVMMEVGKNMGLGLQMGLDAIQPSIAMPKIGGGGGTSSYHGGVTNRITTPINISINATITDRTDLPTLAEKLGRLIRAELADTSGVSRYQPF